MLEAHMNGTSTRMIITIGGKVATSVGKDRIGIVIKLGTILARANASIIDISQTTVKEFFYLIVLADLDKATVPFEELQARLREAGLSLGMKVDAHHENLFAGSSGPDSISIQYGADEIASVLQVARIPVVHPYQNAP